MVNSNKLSTFRWPFYAYATGQQHIVISPLAKTKYLVHHRLDIKEGDERGSI